MILAIVTFVLNMIAVLVLSFGLFNNFENPKSKAVYGYMIAGSTIPYLLSLVLLICWEVFINHNFTLVYLFICVISPFVIGKLVKYETLKKYTVIQILFFLISLSAVFSYFIL